MQESLMYVEMKTELTDGVLLTTAHLVSTDNVQSGGGSGGGASGRVSTFSGSVELGRRLLLAAKHGNTALVLELMAKGAPFTTDWLGTSPLHVAAAGAHVETCNVLLRAGVSRDSRTKVERTPLHLAAHAGHAPVCSLLLERGAAVDCRDMLRMTPLHWAAERGHLATVTVLVKYGADPRAESKFHKTPLSLAASKGHNAILRLMEDALKQQETQHSVDALQLADGDEQTTQTPTAERQQAEQQRADQQQAEQQQALDSIQLLQMQDSVKPLDEANVNRIKIEIENEPARAHHAAHPPASKKQDKTSTETNSEGSGGGTDGAGGAADLLRKHGITLLPHDTSSTVLNAIQSGRTIVLSDAGKLMLKDTPAVPPVINTETGFPTSKGILLSGAPAAKGVILTAAPVKAPPAPGVKIFTLNNKLRAHNENKLPIKKLINPQDVQIKLLPLTGDSKSLRRGGVLTTLPIKAKARRSTLVGSGAGAGAASQPFKIIMQKSNINKLMAKQRILDNSNRLEVNTNTPVQITSSIDFNKVLQASNILPASTVAPPTAGGGGGGGGSAPAGSGFMCVPAEFLSSTSTTYLRSQLITAHRTIHELNNEITSLKQRLANYETV